LVQIPNWLDAAHGFVAGTVAWLQSASVPPMYSAAATTSAMQGPV
jgi:hypothetical protein